MSTLAGQMEDLLDLDVWGLLKNKRFKFPHAASSQHALESGITLFIEWLNEGMYIIWFQAGGVRQAALKEFEFVVYSLRGNEIARLRFQEDEKRPGWNFSPPRRTRKHYVLKLNV